MNLLEVRLEKLCSILGTDPKEGLTAEQVLRNRREFGENILFEKKNSAFDWVRKVFGEIMMILFYLVCLFDYLETGHTASLVALLVVALFESVFVIITHQAVRRARQKVEKSVRCRYHVRRAGSVVSVEKSELVPGDILLLDKGDICPCDGIILKHQGLKILEASVTGRRVPIFKRSHSEVEDEASGYPYFECLMFAGSVVLHGAAQVFVCNTGVHIFDNENFTVSRQNSTIPRIYQTAMELKKQISLIWILVCFFLFAWGVFCGQEIFHIFHFTLAVVVAAFPDSIEHLSDLAIAYLTKRLFDEGVVLRNPGALDLVCDANSVFVNEGEYLYYSHPIADSFYLGKKRWDFKTQPQKAKSLLENILLCKGASCTEKEKKASMERAHLAAAATIGLQRTRLTGAYLTIQKYDFDPSFGFSCALVLKNNRYRLIACGNPASVLAVCDRVREGKRAEPFNETGRTNLRADARLLAEKCEYITAVAVKELSSPPEGDARLACHEMTYLGLFGLSTPISATAANAVSICQKSGIQTYLLTDDYPETVASLSKSVSIIGPEDYQYALSYQTYARMDRGVFLADLDKFKAYCGFPAEDKQSIIKDHKDNGDITFTLTGGFYDTLPQMESDVAMASLKEKQNAVRLNADFLVREKKFEHVPLCINWARILYRNLVHIMQYVLFLQIALGLCLFLSLTATKSLPFALLPLVLVGIQAASCGGTNLFLRRPGPRLEDNRGVLKDDRLASFRALIITPLVAGATFALSVLLSRQVAHYASGSDFTASSAALITLIFGAYFASLAMKYDHFLFSHIKDMKRSVLITFLSSVITALIVTASPLTSLWKTGDAGSGFSFWIFLFSLLFSLLPAGMVEWMKFLKKEDDFAPRRDS